MRFPLGNFTRTVPSLIILTTAGGSPANVYTVDYYCILEQKNTRPIKRNITTVCV